MRGRMAAPSCYERPMPAEKNKPLLLLVDDDDSVRRSLHLLLQFRGYEVRSFASAAPLVGDDAAHDALFMVADHRLPDGDGIDVLQRLRAAGWCGRAVLITGYPSAVLRERAEQAGFSAVLEKPLRQHELLRALN